MVFTVLVYYAGVSIGFRVGWDRYLLPTLLLGALLSGIGAGAALRHWGHARSPAQLALRHRQGQRASIRWRRLFPDARLVRLLPAIRRSGVGGERKRELQAQAMTRVFPPSDTQPPGRRGWCHLLRLVGKSLTIQETGDQVRALRGGRGGGRGHGEGVRCHGDS